MANLKPAGRPTRITPGIYLIALVMFGVSLILMLMTFLNNVPLFNTHTTLADRMGDITAWLITINETTATTGSTVPGQLEYGFGVWGWCEWGNSPVAETGFATCTLSPFWSIPSSAQPGDGVDVLGLPR